MPAERLHDLPVFLGIGVSIVNVRDAGTSGLLERTPERRQLAIAQDALAAAGLMPVDAGARIDGNDLFFQTPGEDPARRREHLVGKYRLFDAREHDLDIAARDVS